MKHCKYKNNWPLSVEQVVYLYDLLRAAQHLDGVGGNKRRDSRIRRALIKLLGNVD